MIHRFRTSLLFLVACAAAFALEPSLTYHPDSRRISFGPLERARLGLTLDGKQLWATDAADAQWTPGQDGAGRLTLRFDAPPVVWTIELRRGQDGDSATISSTIRNTGPAPVRLGPCRLAELTDDASSIRLGPGSEKTLLLVSSGAQTKTFVRTLSGPSHAISRTLAQLYNPESKQSLQLGFLSFDRVHTEHELWWDDAHGRIASSSYCDFAGFALSPGATIASEELGLSLQADPTQSLIHWGDLAQARYHPSIWPKIPGGWLGWSWVDGIHVERYQDVVQRNLRAIRERLPGLDIEYVWVSIGNLKDTLPGNWLEWNYQNFPAGPQALVRTAAQLNFKLGFWIAPFWVSGKSAPAGRLTDTFVSVGGKRLVIPHGDLLGDSFALDPTHPQTHAFLREVLSTYRKWGIRYYMVDFLNAVSGPVPGSYKIDSFNNKKLVPGPETLRAGLEVIRKAAGPDTYLLASTGPTFWMVGLLDAARAGTDYGEGRPLEGPGKNFYPGTFVINKADYWTSHNAALRAMATAFYTHRKLYIADSGNVFTIDKPVSLPDAQITATLFGLNGGPLMLGDDIERMDSERLEMVKQQFPRLPEVALPADLFEAPDPDYPKIFRLPVQRPYENYELAAVFNLGEQPLNRSLAFASAGPHRVWDHWNQRYLGTRTGPMKVQVPGHSVSLLRFSPARDYPWLLSTDMHIRQGQADIEDCRWDAQAQTLTIAAARPAAYRGNVYVLAPKGFAVKNPAGLWLAKDGNDASLIIRCPFEFGRGGRETKTIEFARIP